MSVNGATSTSRYAAIPHDDRATKALGDFKQAHRQRQDRRGGS